ncbi:hypothetical protein [Nocardioides sp.]|uniref:hypothetical protein n=1 Tax=Nocardioides sp. TaxID=35761 RepID=UPI0035157CCA
MLRRAAVAVLSSAVALSALAPTPTATAGPGRDVGLEQFRDIVVDDTHGRVFISQGTDTIVVTDLDGIATDVVTGLPGAAGMALSDDDSTLYVAAYDAGAIGVVDTETLALTTIDVGADTCPYDLALSAGMVWFTRVCHTRTIGAVNPVDGSVHLDLSPASYPQGVRIDASPARPGELFAYTSAAIYSFTAQGGDSPTLTQRLEREGRFTYDTAISPDGARLLTTGGPVENEALALSTEDFTVVDSYRVAKEENAVAVAVREDGMVALGSPATSRPDVFVFEAGSTTPMRTYELGSSVRVLTGAMAFGETSLYLVTDHTDGTFLKVIQPRHETTLRVKTDSRRYDYAETAKVTVTLDGGETNRDVEVFALPKGEKDPVMIASGRVADGGVLRARFEVTRPTAFSATYAGDDSFDPAEDKTKPVEVKADLRTTMLRSRGKAGRYHLYVVGERATLQATLLPKGFPRRCVTVRVQFLVRGKWGYDGKTPCLTPDRRSRVRGYVTGSPQLAGVPLRMRAEFRGDKVHARTTSSWSLIKFRR